jgi:uncharacterized membrane protein YfcA
MLLILTPLLFGLSFLSGMLGLGVAFVAIPVLGLFGYDLINEIQPWALLLNGLTAISGAIAFWKAGLVDKRGALILIVITTIGAPVGVWLLQFASTDLVWWLYVGVLVFLAARMLLPSGPRRRMSPRSRTRIGPGPPSPRRRSASSRVSSVWARDSCSCRRLRLLATAHGSPPRRTPSP